MDRDHVVTRLRESGCVFAEDEADMLLSAASTAEQLTTLVARRAEGEPLQHVVGWAEFCGERIVVDPGVFVPRPRTELLAREALARTRPGGVVVELCCGTAAISTTLLAAVPDLELYATDIEPAAVRCARRNLPADRVVEGDLFDPLPPWLRGRVGVLVANVPYVPTAEIALMPAEARLHEPQVALDGGADGLDVLRRVVSEAPSWLAPGGVLLVETSRRQRELAVAVVAAGGLRPAVARDDELDATVVLGQLVSSTSSEVPSAAVTRPPRDRPGSVRPSGRAARRG